MFCLIKTDAVTFLLESKFARIVGLFGLSKFYDCALSESESGK